MSDDGQYHAAAAYVHAGRWALTLQQLWDGVDDAERNGVMLDQIGAALASNWCASACALGFRNIAVLRVLVAEARS